MAANVNSFGLVWDFPIEQSLSESGKWVLSAMQSHGQELVMMLWRILGNEQDVCDAYQDTFLKLAHYEGGQKPDHIKSYIFRSAANTAVSMLRHKIVERKNLSRVYEVRNDNYDAADFNAGQLKESLRNCVAMLPEHFRNVITLHDLAEMSYSQTGKILGITEATARVYRSKAIQMLAVWMNRKEKNDK